MTIGELIAKAHAGDRGARGLIAQGVWTYIEEFSYSMPETEEGEREIDDAVAQINRDIAASQTRPEGTESP